MEDSAQKNLFLIGFLFVLVIVLSIFFKSTTLGTDKESKDSSTITTNTYSVIKR